MKWVDKQTHGLHVHESSKAASRCHTRIGKIIDRHSKSSLDKHALYPIELICSIVLMFATTHGHRFCLPKAYWNIGASNVQATKDLIARHWSFYGHEQKIAINVECLLCRKCGEAEETVRHVLFDCRGLCLSTFSVSEQARERGERQDSMWRVSGFCKDPGFNSIWNTVTESAQ